MSKYIFIVTCRNYNEKEPILTCFDNEEAAHDYKCYNYLRYDSVQMDMLPIYNSFNFDKNEQKEPWLE